jgi:PKHD-type hydroxylase
MRALRKAFSMFLEIPDLLTPQELAQLRSIAVASPFADGRITNPHNITKNNQQIDFNSAGYKESAALLHTALMRNEVFRDFAYPKAVAPPLLCRYGPGQSYGVHSDTAMQNVFGRRMRFDVSCTIFISDPEDCVGGELTAHFGDKTIKVKGAAGSAIVYPSVTLHEVAPIASGVRLVAITFIESEIRDPAKRELLYLLNEVYALEGNQMEWKNRILLKHVHTALYRMWGE